MMIFSPKKKAPSGDERGGEGRDKRVWPNPHQLNNSTSLPISKYKIHKMLHNYYGEAGGKFKIFSLIFEKKSCMINLQSLDTFGLFWQLPEALWYGNILIERGKYYGND